jgi:hypothetical protein
MAFTLEQIVPWGRSFDEYTTMFHLSPADLEKRLLGCGDGPACFNGVLTRQGGCIVSADPLYHFSQDEIRRRIDKTFAEVMEQTRKNAHEFVWESILSVDELGRIRMDAMNEFLSDYPAGLRQGRYVDAGLPDLPFKDRAFDIALCSHFLFLYSEQLSEDFHCASIRELCRVASEARIFPLLELGAKRSRHLEKVMVRLQEEGYDVSVEKVMYEFQKGGNEMLKVMAT